VKPKRERLNLTIDKKERGKSLLLSVAIHVVIIFALAAITFRYPLGQLIGLPKDRAQTERLQYMVLPRGEVGNGRAPGMLKSLSLRRFAAREETRSCIWSRRDRGWKKS